MAAIRRRPRRSARRVSAPRISFALLLNLVAVANAESKAVLWAFLRRYAPSATPQTHPRLDALVGYAIRYFRDFVKPAKRYHEPTAAEREALGEAFGDPGRRCPTAPRPLPIQDAVYDVGRSLPQYQDMKAKGATPERPGVSLDWFNTLYRILLGEERGPRFGSFVAIYGLAETRALIAKALSGELKREHEGVAASPSSRLRRFGRRPGMATPASYMRGVEIRRVIV